ncbi:MAG: NirA family protein, partial [Limisphaerales bacterium]
MTESVPFDSINGDKLSLEQKYYLEGIFAGLRNRGVSFADVLANPVNVRAPDLDSLIAEERIKRELHPLD